MRFNLTSGVTCNTCVRDAKHTVAAFKTILADKQCIDVSHVWFLANNKFVWSDIEEKNIDLLKTIYSRLYTVIKASVRKFTFSDWEILQVENLQGLKLCDRKKENPPCLQLEVACQWFSKCLSYVCSLHLVSHIHPEKRLSVGHIRSGGFSACLKASYVESTIWAVGGLFSTMSSYREKVLNGCVELQKSPPSYTVILYCYFWCMLAPVAKKPITNKD